MIIGAVWDKVVNNKDFSESWDDACENPTAAVVSTIADVVPFIPGLNLCMAARVGIAAVKVGARASVQMSKS